MGNIISKKEAEHIAYLARLQFNNNELSRYQKELGEILTYVRQIQEADIPKALFTIPEAKRNISTNVFRKDRASKCRRGLLSSLLNKKFIQRRYLRVPLIFQNND